MVFLLILGTFFAKKGSSRKRPLPLLRDGRNCLEDRITCCCLCGHLFNPPCGYLPRPGLVDLDGASGGFSWILLVINNSVGWSAWKTISWVRQREAPEPLDKTSESQAMRRSVLEPRTDKGIYILTELITGGQLYEQMRDRFCDLWYCQGTGIEETVQHWCCCCWWWWWWWWRI